MGVCSEMMDVFHIQRVCPVGNPCSWPNCVPPQRRVCVYDAVFFGRNICRINVLSSPCLCTANSGLRERVLLPNPVTVSISLKCREEEHLAQISVLLVTGSRF